MLVTRSARLAVLVLALSASARAQRTWVVDDDGGPGVDFRQVQPAVDAAAPGDIVEVRAGAYDAPVVVTKGIKVLGDPGASLAYLGWSVPEIRIRDVPASGVLAIRGFDGARVRARDCAGAVVLVVAAPLPFGLSMQGGGAFVDAEDCADVRVRGRRIDRAIASRVEVVQTPATLGPVIVDSGATLHAAHTTIHGESPIGSCPNFSCWEPDGLPGILMRGGSDVLLAGCEVLGGDGAEGLGFPGFGAPAISAGLRSLRLSDSVVLGGCHGGSGGTHCTRAPSLETFGTDVVDVAPRVDPTLQLVGDVVPGGQVTMRVTGTPGDNLRFFMGRQPRRQAVAGSPVPLLTSPDRVSAIGAIPPAGFVDHPWTIPAHWTPGTLLFTQVSAVAPSGQGILSNSVPLLVH